MSKKQTYLSKLMNNDVNIYNGTRNLTLTCTCYQTQAIKYQNSVSAILFTQKPIFFWAN